MTVAVVLAGYAAAALATAMATVRLLSARSGGPKPLPAPKWAVGAVSGALWPLTAFAVSLVAIALVVLAVLDAPIALAIIEGRRGEPCGL